MGTKNATTTAVQTPPSWVNNAYKGIFNTAGQIASQPYQAYTGGFTPDQQSAFSHIGQLWNSGSPNFQAANSAITSAMRPTYETVGNYMSPYIDEVAKRTMANMNELNGQQQQQVVGNAIAKGAYGGDRVGVAQSELARQQGLANNQQIAQLYQDAFQSAMGSAQNQQQVGLQAGAGYGNLGSTEMASNLSQTAAQLGAGTQQQQFDYAQYLNKQGFPYQQASWLSSILGNIGPNAGGTKTQQTPQGNWISQLLGLGIDVAGLFRDGGSVPHRAGGGGVVPYGLPSDSPWPSFVADSAPYTPSTTGFGSYIPGASEAGRTSPPDVQIDEYKDPSESNPFSNPSALMSKGASNIKDWVGFADGGVVPMHFTSGRPGSTNIEDRRGWKGGDDPLGELIKQLSNPRARFNPFADFQIEDFDPYDPTPQPYEQHFSPQRASGGVVPHMASGGYPRYSPGFNPSDFYTGSMSTSAPFVAQPGSLPSSYNGGMDPIGPGLNWLQFDDQFNQPSTASSSSGYYPGDLTSTGGKIGYYPSGGTPPSLTAISDALNPPLTFNGPTNTPGVVPAGDPWAGMRVGNSAPVAPRAGYGPAPGMRTAPAARQQPRGLFGLFSQLFQHPAAGGPSRAPAARPAPTLRRVEDNPAAAAARAAGKTSYNASKGSGVLGENAGMPLTDIHGNARNTYGDFASGGAVPHLATGGSPYSSVNVDDLFPPNTPYGPLPEMGTKEAALRALALSLPNAPSPAAPAATAAEPAAGVVPPQEDYTPQPPPDYGPDAYVSDQSLQPAGQPTYAAAVPFGSGDQFVTNPDPQYSQNIGDVFRSLGEGKGLNLAPDVRQALLSAGAGMMASKSPFALQGVGEGVQQGIDTWGKRQTVERENALARANLTKAGFGDIPLTQAQTGLAQITGAATQYTFSRTPAGVMVTDAMHPDAPPRFVPWGGILPDGTTADPATMAGGMQTEQPGFFDTRPQKVFDPRLMSPDTVPLVTGESSAAIADARAQQQGALTSNQIFEEMRTDLDRLPKDGGLLTQGTGFNTRLGLARGINTAFQAVGLTSPFDEKEVAAAEDLNKLTFRLGGELSKGIGSNAASIIMDSVSAVPSGIQSKEGAERIISGLQAMNQRKIDYYIALQNWQAANSGSTYGFDAYFNAVNPPELYALHAYVPEAAMQKLRAHPDLASDFNDKYGNGRNVARYVLGR